MTSLTKHALEVAGFVLLVSLLVESQIAIRRSSTSRDSKPSPNERRSYHRQWATIRYETAYSPVWVGIRILECSVIAIALIVALISFIV
jgi:hypothetical protein